MTYPMLACFIKRRSSISDEKVVEPPLKVAEAVYRDELIIKKPPVTCKAVKKSVRFADNSEPDVSRGDCEKELVKGSSGGGGGNSEGGERGAGIRVKVKMTKEEAARLLSKCKEGGVLEFKDVARELVGLPMNRVSVVSTSTNK